MSSRGPGAPDVDVHPTSRCSPPPAAHRRVRREQRVAVAEVQRCRSQLERGAPDVDPDTVSAALALQIGYDVALLRLAGLVGIESDPSRFDRPYDERTRLEGALAERGISLRENGAGSEPVGRVGPPGGTLRSRWRPSACPEPTARSAGPRTWRPGSVVPCPAWPAGSRRSSSPSSRPGTSPRRSDGWSSPPRSGRGSGAPGG